MRHHLVGFIALFLILWGIVYFIVARPWVNTRERVGRRWPESMADWLLLGFGLFLFVGSAIGGNPVTFLMGIVVLVVAALRLRRRVQSRS